VIVCVKILFQARPSSCRVALAILVSSFIGLARLFCAWRTRETPPPLFIEGDRQHIETPEKSVDDQRDSKNDHDCRDANVFENAVYWL